MSSFLGVSERPNLTGSDIKAAYEAEPNTNEFSDDKSQKLNDLDRLKFDSVPEFVASEAGFSAGEFVHVVGGGFSYKTAPIIVTDFHISNAAGMKFYVVPDAYGRVSADAINCAGDGVASDTAKLNRLIDAGFEVVLTKGKTYLYDGVSKAVSGLRFSGEGTLLGTDQTAFVWGEGGDIVLTDATFKNFASFIASDTTGLTLGDATEQNVTWDNVAICWDITGTGSIGRFVSDDVKATDFTKVHNLVMYGFKSVRVFDGEFDAELGWDGTSSVTHTGQRWVTWVGNRLTDKDLGPVWIKNNEARNVVTREGRADGFLVQTATSVLMTGNDIKDVLPSQDYFEANGYIDYSLGGNNAGSGLYSNAPNATIEGNTLVDAGAAQIACTGAADNFIAMKNRVTATSGKWTDRNFYIRASSGKVNENVSIGSPKPIYSINPDAQTVRPLEICDNIIQSPTGGVGVILDGSRRGVKTNGNLVSGVVNTHPLYLPYIAAVLYTSSVSNQFREGECVGNTLAGYTDTRTTAYIAAVIMAATGTAVISLMKIADNMVTVANAPAVGLIGGNQLHTITGNVRNGSGDIVAIWGSEPKSFLLGPNYDAEGVNTQTRKLVQPNIATDATTRDNTISGIFGGRVVLTRRMLQVEPTTSLGAAKSWWLSDLTASNVRINFDAAPGIVTSFDVMTDLTNQLVEVQAA